MDLISIALAKKFAEVNGENGSNVDMTNYYTKEEIDNKINEIETGLEDIIDEVIGGIENGSY